MLDRDRATRLMDELNLDLVVATSPENIYYLTGIAHLSHWRHPQNKVLALLCRVPYQISLVVHQMEIDLVVEEAGDIEEIVPYGCFFYDRSRQMELSPQDERIWNLIGNDKAVAADHVEALRRHLLGSNARREQIGVEDIDEHKREAKVVYQVFPRAGLMDAREFFKRLRRYKSSEEISVLCAAIQMNEAAIRSAVVAICDGVTEEYLASVVLKKLVEQGATPAWIKIGFGPRSAYPFAEPSGRKLSPGDIVRFETGCRYKNYYSDTAKTFLFKNAPLRARLQLEAVIEGERAARSLILPGTPAKKLFEAAVFGVRKSGIEGYNRHHCGHGIGINVYESPMIGSNDEILEEGMVLNIETPYYELGFGGVQVENTYLVTRTGFESLSSYSPEEEEDFIL